MQYDDSFHLNVDCARAIEQAMNRRKLTTVCALALALTTVLSSSAFAAEGTNGGPHASPAQRVAWGKEEQGSGANSARQGGVSGADFATTCYPSYPTAVTRSEDGTEIRKMYDLGPEDDPVGIPRSDFEQDGYHYILTDLLKQELPANESREHTETVSVASKNKDMASVLALLPQTKDFVTDDGLSGTLSLQLDTVKVDVAGYGSATKNLTATRTYPGLADQDTQYIPKSVNDSGSTLTLQSIDWQAQADGYFTAVATYTGSATSSYVKGYTVTADYTGTVSRINLSKTRYVAIFEGTPLKPQEPEPSGDPSTEESAVSVPFNWAYLLVPLGAVALIGGGVGVALFLKRRNENEEDAE